MKMSISTTSGCNDVLEVEEFGGCPWEQGKLVAQDALEWTESC